MFNLLASINSYYKKAQQRTKNNKCILDYLLVPFVVLGSVISWILLTKCLLNIQHSLIPSSAFLSSYTRIGSIIIHVVPILPAIVVGLICANFVMWLIYIIRKKIYAEMNTDQFTVFVASMKSLLKTVLLVSIIATPACYFGIQQYFYVQEDGIYLSSLFHSSDKHYAWADIKEVHTGCTIDRRNLELNYIVIMNDSSEIDLMRDTRLQLVDVFYKLRPYIMNSGNIVYKQNISNSGIKLLEEQYGTETASRILSVITVKQ